MNKRGISMLSILLILIALAVGTAVTMSGVSPDKIKEISENNLTVDNVDFTMEDYPEFEHALEYYINGMLQAYIEITKWVMNYSANNPQIPYKLLLYLFLIAVFSPIILVLVKLLIIIFLLIKEWRQTRKEKKELMRIKYENLDR